MFSFCNNENLKIISDNQPHIEARAVLPSCNKEEIKDIKKFPFISTKNTNFFITDKTDNEEYRILIPKGFKTDLASIPFGFRWLFGGKSNPHFIVAAIVHDKLCNDKYLIKYNRELSTLIFKELLLSSGYNKNKADVMAWAVNNYQKFFNNYWRLICYL